jgi:glycosyltransferase involved in cell wall biosynthesis
VKVLHVINSLGGSGGAEHGLVREITRFSPDTEQKVVRLFEKDHLDPQLTAAGIEVIGLGLRGRRAGWTWPEAVRRLGGIIRDRRPHVIHSSLFTANLVAQVAGRRAGIPVVSTLTLSGDVDLLRRYQPGADSWRASALRRLAARVAQHPSIHFRALTRDALVTNCALLGVPPSRAAVIPRGIEMDLMPTERKSRQELGLPPSEYLLVNVGRQTAQKGHLSLLDAFEVVRKEADAHLAIVGREGDSTERLRAEIKERELGPHITLVGYTPDVHHYMAQADIFVFTSFMEGLGTAVVEAMAMGLPVVAYDIPPVREITDDGRVARLVEMGDSEAFARTVLEVLVDGVDVGKQLEWVERHFAIDEVASRVEALLVRVAGS